MELKYDKFPSGKSDYTERCRRKDDVKDATAHLASRLCALDINTKLKNRKDKNIYL